jgi:hypothetical protein
MTATTRGSLRSTPRVSGAGNTLGDVAHCDWCHAEPVNKEKPLYPAGRRDSHCRQFAPALVCPAIFRKVAMRAAKIKVICRKH